MFDEIRAAFEKANPDMVYVEGFGEYINSRKEEVRKQAQEISIEEAKTQGENFYTLKLAIDAGAEFESPELTRAEEVSQLEKSDFSHQDIFNFYFARSVYGYQRQAKDPSKKDCLEYISRFMKRLRKESGWSDEEFDTFEQRAIENLDVENHTYQELGDPIPWHGTEQHIENDISRRLSLLRNEYGIERISEGLKKHNRIFVVYGSAHAVQLEPALKQLLQIRKD